MKKEFITMYQRPPLYFPEPGSHEYLFFLEAGKVSNTFILPEYFSFENNIFNPEELFTQSKKTLKRLVNLSSTKEFKNTLVIGGSLILRQNQFLYNAAPIIYNGKVLSYYFKKTLFEKEKYFLTHGKENLIITHPLTGKKIGILICADVLDNQNFKSYRNIDYIAIPVASPFRSEDTPEIQRERDKSIFLAASRETNT
jgi:predicted amidohydrolase